MKNGIINGLTAGHKNFVFIGEAGSGKTEVGLNLALRMAELGDRKVHFFDLDQTKPLFRARDVAGTLERQGIVFHFQAQYLDAPTVASGIVELLQDDAAVVLLDIGGGAHGSQMIGQFSHILNRGNTRVLYLVNPYRPWSGSTADIECTMARVAGAARLRQTELVANPNLGPGTTADDVVAGEKKLRAMFPETPVSFLCALEALCAELEGRVSEPVFPIRLNTLPDWLD